MTTGAPPAFVAPADLTPGVLALAERIWAQAQPESLPELDDSEDLIATLLGLDQAGGHDPLARCGIPGCGAWFWGEDGAVLEYEDTGRSFEVCAGHAYPDDPGCRVYPGAGLEARWREERAATECGMIRADGNPPVCVPGRAPKDLRAVIKGWQERLDGNREG